MDYEYVRNGTSKLLAAFDPHTGDVYAEVRESRTAQDLVEFMGGYRFEMRKNGRVRWQYRGTAPGVTHAVLQEAGGGAYRLTAQIQGLDLVVTTFPAVQLRIGDDWAVTDIPLRGQLRAPSAGLPPPAGGPGGGLSALSGGGVGLVGERAWGRFRGDGGGGRRGLRFRVSVAVVAVFYAGPRL